jgi:hypothetical protein
VAESSGWLRWFKRLWLSFWPLLALCLFGSLSIVRLLPGGYARAVVAVPILLIVPGSLTLGVVFSQRRRPRGAAFIVYAALLGTIWSALASVALYFSGRLITADSTYWSLLTASAVLAVAAEVRLLLWGPGRGRRAYAKPEVLNPDLSDAEVNVAEMPMESRRSGSYVVLAGVTGVCLLAGAVYTYDHLPHPSPVGYTYMDWIKPSVRGTIEVGSTGTKLHFQIVHRQSDTTKFQLSAVWLGHPSRPLAKSVTFRVGPNQTFRGALFVPPLPNRCTYRIVVALTAFGQLDSLTKQPQTWSINADVHDPNKSLKACK